MENELDFVHEDIKRRVEDCYAIIKTAQEELENLREAECKHPQTEKVNYAWAPGHTMPDTEVCAVCGKVMNNYWNNLEWGVDDEKS
jgi:hypothetical protein